MNIAYMNPLSRAWNRMKKALFHPFDLSKWFAVGFTSFLAGLTDFHGRGGNLNSRWHGGHDIRHFPGNAWEWLMENPGWFYLILFGVLFLIGLGILLTWLSSRGKFMFLDNVVHNRAQVVKPWHQFKKLGNSLFLWRLCFGLICFAIVIVFLIFCFNIIFNGPGSGFRGSVSVLAIIGLALLWISFAIITGYINLLLNDFVVPIMYKNDTTTVKAWGRFLHLFKQHILYFIFYGLVMFLLGILAIICVVIVGLFTCCIGILLLIIPYIGSVYLLPISYTFRAFSLEFFEQFGPEFKLFPPSGDVPAKKPA